MYMKAVKKLNKSSQNHMATKGHSETAYLRQRVISWAF